MVMKTSINLSWDKRGRINHQFTGDVLPPHRNNRLLWVLAPSVPLFLVHQYGSMRPSHALIISSKILEMLFENKYLLTPINNALKGAKLEFIYPGGPAVKVQFHPMHSFLANNDSIEEGVRQLINNYTHYVFSMLDDYSRIVVKTMSLVAMGAYFIFLEEQIQAKTIAILRDQWMFALPLISAKIISTVSAKYYVPEGGKNKENDEWARKQSEFLIGKYAEVKDMLDSLFV